MADCSGQVSSLRLGAMPARRSDATARRGEALPRMTESGVDDGQALHASTIAVAASSAAESEVLHHWGPAALRRHHSIDEDEVRLKSR